jgi:hemolysin activation/secretion protein
MLTVVDVVGYPLKRLEFADAIYSIPLNAKGTTLTLSYLYSHFRVARFHELRLKGDSNIASIKLTQALKRTKSLSTNAYVNFDYKQIRNLTLNEVTSFDKLRVLELGMTFDYIDPIKGRNVIDVYEDIGLPRFLGGLKAIDDRASRQGSGGMFFITSLDYERIQPLPKDIFLITNLFGQYCPNKLPLAQQFYIGGFDTVRGFKAAVALGDSGYFVNLELRFPPFGIADKKVPEMKKTWKEFIQFIGFIDHGDVFLKNGPRSEGLKSHTSLTGAGAGVRIYGPYRFNFSLDVGFPLTETDRPSDSVIYLKVSWNPL